MAVPKKRKSRAKAATVKAGRKKVVFTALQACANCGAPCKSHHLCVSCGHYNGRIYTLKAKDYLGEDVLTTASKKNKPNIPSLINKTDAQDNK